jgi:hypothetical protein
VNHDAPPKVPVRGLIEFTERLKLVKKTYFRAKLSRVIFIKSLGKEREHPEHPRPLPKKSVIYRLFES